MTGSSSADAPRGPRSIWKETLGAWLAVTLAVAACSLGVFGATGEKYAGLVAALGFLYLPFVALAWARVRIDLLGEEFPRPRWLAGLGWAALAMLVTFPPFVVAHHFWVTGVWGWSLDPHLPVWDTRLGITAHPAAAIGQMIVVQLGAVALPEEFFYRGYLQRRLEAALGGAHWRILGAPLGWGWLLAAALFGLGHVISWAEPLRIGVALPALAFGWLRVRSGTLVAPIAYHAACNVLTWGLETMIYVKG